MAIPSETDMIARSLDTHAGRVISETRDAVPLRLPARALNPMSAEESEQLRLLEWFQYCRIDNGKANLGVVQPDRVQLQQVILNLIANAMEVMSGMSEGSRELLISTGKAELGGVRVAVQGPGLAPATLERLFEAFYTTKSNGLGMGLGESDQAPRCYLWIHCARPRRHCIVIVGCVSHILLGTH
jgi:signal transduction histidine kinase